MQVSATQQTSFIGMPAGVEARRIDVVRRYDILDTPPDGAFDRVTALAARLFSVPISIISIVDSDRIWFKSHHGLDLSEIPRDSGLCASAILYDRPWVVTDAKIDPRALANPLVAGDFGLRFYVGIPLRTSDGYKLGTLCVLDQEPHPVSERQLADLGDLASVVMDEMELRLSARRAIGELSKAVEEKEEALVRARATIMEVEQRVMSSLQLISLVLMLQSKQHEHSAAGPEIARAAERIGAIARVHQHLHIGGEFRNTDAILYLRRLCDELAGLLMDEGDVSVAGLPLPMSTPRLVSLGLIVNELVTNAIRHGATRIRVSLRRSGPTQCELLVVDDGPGLPQDFDPWLSTGLGMKMILALARTLSGSLQFSSGTGGKGTSAAVSFLGDM